MNNDFNFKNNKKEEKKKLFEELRKYNKFKGKARYVVKSHTRWVDETLSSFFGNFGGKKDFCVIATGGYGRRQLNPASDIDLLVLSENKSEFFEYLIREIYDLLYFLGYECSVSFRNTEECIYYSLEDDTIMTSLVDSRLIYGSKSLFDSFKNVFEKEVISKNKYRFIENKIEYMRARYSKFGETVFVLEPNVKEGVGSLRDYHTLIWIAKAMFSTKNALDMKKKNIIADDDYKKIKDALYFLWQLRNALHFDSLRKNDILFLDLRDKIADELGLSSNSRFSKAERLMRKYYYNARNMERVVNTYIKSFFKKESPSYQFIYLDDKVKSNGELVVDDEIDFRQLLFLFYYSAVYSKPISIDTLQKIKPFLPLVAKYRSDKTFAFVFKDILSLNMPITNTIRIMHESGVLDKYIPEFGNVCCLTEDSLYHKYTVDEHSIQALKYLDNLYYYDIPKTFVMRLAYLWKNLKPFDRIALRLAVLLHDIGKIEKRHHEIVGANMVDKISSRLKLGETLTQKVKFLVKNHLLISRIISTLDVEDNKTLDNFMKIVGSKNKLNLLVLLTYADMKAVNDNVWTSWKETLIETLYLKATYAMENKDYDEYMKTNALNTKETIKSILGVGYSDLLDVFPDNIFNDIDVNSMIKYIKDIKDTGRNVFVYKESKELARVVVYYDNKFGFFNRISGILACLDVNIVAARSYNLHSSKVVDIFRVRIGDSVEINDYVIEDMLSSVESGDVDLEACMERKRGKFMSRLEKAKLEIALQNINVIVDNELSDLYTVIRIYAPDRIGLVYYVTKVFTEFRFQVGMFILDTKGTIAVDTFYVVDEGMRKIYSQKIIDLLKSKLYEVLV